MASDDLAHPIEDPQLIDPILELGIRFLNDPILFSQFFTEFDLVVHRVDFSLGFRYGPEEVRAQIRAAREQGVLNWILWNPQNRYNWEALRPPRPKPSILPPRRSPSEPGEF